MSYYAKYKPRTTAKRWPPPPVNMTRYKIERGTKGDSYYTIYLNVRVPEIIEDPDCTNGVALYRVEFATENRDGTWTLRLSDWVHYAFSEETFRAKDVYMKVRQELPRGSCLVIDYVRK